MKKILVLVADYPDNNGKVTLMYVHTRILAYIKNNIDVTVLNFNTLVNYEIEGVKVISLDYYKKNNNEYDILVLHAVNLRNHYKFLNKYGDRFKRFVFFFHGHEVLKINKDYSKPYRYNKPNKIKDILQNCYDICKLYLWKKYFIKVVYKSDFIFVSKWMYDKFLLNTKIKEDFIKEKSHITYNSVGYEFERNIYDEKNKKEYDFVTIRANFDNSKYAIDIVNRLACNTPNAKFLLIGKGDFFKYYKKASNIIWLDKNLSHNEIIDILQKCRFALMPTRTDAQGLMMCEMAAFGIPVITSDIPVCHEIFDDFDNVTYINNLDEKLNLNKYLNAKNVSLKDERYFLKETILKELSILNKDN